MPRLSLSTVEKKIKALQKQRSKLEAAANKKTAKNATKVLALMKKLGVSVGDLGGSTSSGGRKASGKAKKAGGKPKGSAPAKFKNPADGATWTGVGRPPAWIVAAEKEGKNRSEFAI